MEQDFHDEWPPFCIGINFMNLKNKIVHKQTHTVRENKKKSWLIDTNAKKTYYYYYYYLGIAYQKL